MDAMRVAVVTPYYRENDDILRQCIQSVAAQTHPATQILIADGFPRPWAAQTASRHVTLPGEGHSDFGNLARAIGAAIAVSEKFDAIALLDADNWYQPDHIARLVALHHNAGAAICTSARSLHRTDGSLLAAHDRHSDGIAFTDTSCLLYMPEAFPLLPLWGKMPTQFTSIGDRIMWAAIQTRKFSTEHSGIPTVAYRTPYCVHYKAPGETLPLGCKGQEEIDQAIRLWNGLSNQERLSILLCV